MPISMDIQSSYAIALRSTWSLHGINFVLIKKLSHSLIWLFDPWYWRGQTSRPIIHNRKLSPA